MQKLFFILLLMVSGNLFSQISKDHLLDFKIIIDMMDSVKKITTLRYKMNALERVDHGYLSANTTVKLQMHPRRSYLQNTEKKLEVLYNEGQLNNKCLVKPHVFPYFTLTLDPRGSLMRKNQHFTIFELGFDFTVKTIVMALSKEKENVAKHLTLVGKAVKNKMNCYVLIYENNAFGYHDYKVQDKETVGSIASKLVVSDYMIRSKNDLYNEYGFVKAGIKIKIPNYYCKKAIFYIDELTMLPVSISLYDDVGLFENYEYYDIELNKPIPVIEFNRNYKGYGF